ncbi:MAG: hypothetical protein QME49_01950 [bacterium]|nr:hypothetical protein [bacterium]
MMCYIAAIIIALTTVVSENAFAVYGEGNYSIDVEAVNKRLNSINFDLKLRGRERLTMLSPILKGNINLQEKSLVFTYTQADFFNPFIDLSVGQNVLPGVSGLTASAPQINGVRLASNKKLWKDRLTPAVFKGVSSSNSDVYGGKIDMASKSGILGNAFYFKDARSGDAIGGSMKMPLLFWKVVVEPGTNSGVSSQGSRTVSGTSTNGESGTKGTETVGSSSVGTSTTDNQDNVLKDDAEQDVQTIGSLTTGTLTTNGTQTAGTQTVLMIGTTTSTIYPLNLSMDYSTGKLGGDGYKIGGVFKLKRISSDIKYSLINKKQNLTWNSSYGFKRASFGLGYSEDRSAASMVNNWKLNAGYGTSTRSGNVRLNGEYSRTNGNLPANNIDSWKIGSDYGTATGIGNMKLNTEYSRTNGELSANDAGKWKITGLFDSKRVGDIKLNSEYSVSSSPCVTNNTSLLKCNGEFKLGKRFWLNGAFSKDNIVGTSSSHGSLGYSWNLGHRWNFSKELNLTLTRQQSFRELIRENDQNLVNNLSVKMDFLPQFPLSISSGIGLEKTDSISKSKLKKQLSLKRDISLRYSYNGFNPWISYNITGIDDRTIANSDISRENITIGIKKKLTRNLSCLIQRMCQREETQYKSNNKMNFVERASTEKKVNLIYKFPNYPLNMDLEFFSRNEQKFNWKISFTFREKDKQNYFRYLSNDIKFTEAKEFRFGASPDDMTPISKKLPDKNEFSKLGVVSVSVFKDVDANRVFSSDEEGLEGINVIIFEKGESKEKAKKVATNKNGKACFVDVPSGAYNLNIDLGSVPIDFICVAELEQVIKVEAGKVIELKFPLQKAGTVEGRVFRDENRNGVWDAGETGDHDLMVYANDTPTFTGSGGMYRFSNIPPVKIRMRVDKTCLPKKYILTTPEFFDVDLKPEDEIKGIDFGMAEQEMEIEF